ncbi:MAG: hypothetical protein U0350_04190 [Caldilineaceae bacterium]
MVDPDIFNEVTRQRFNKPRLGSVIPPQWPSETVFHVCRRHAPTIVIPNGAGHDTNSLPLMAPDTRLFVASSTGRNYAPEENTAPEALARGVQALARMMVSVDKRC